MAGFVCLLFNKETRIAGSVFIAGWAIYTVTTLNAGTAFYYMSAATIEAGIAYVLNKRHRAVAYLGYSLILVNIYGLLLYKLRISPISYDIIYAVISITQFLLLLSRLALNGINRLPPEHFMVRLVDFDSGQARGIMCKNKIEKEANP